MEQRQNQGSWYLLRQNVVTRRRALSALPLAVAVASLTACKLAGGSGAAAPAPATTPAPQSSTSALPTVAQPQPTATTKPAPIGRAELLIGTTVSSKGSSAASAAYQQQAYALWEEQVNQRGGLLGRPVKLVVLDDEGQPAAAVKLFEQLINQESVDLLLGPHTSSVTAAATTVTERHGFPLLTPGVVAADVWKRNYRHVFGVQPVPDASLNGVLEYAASTGVRSLAILHESTPFPNATALTAATYAKSLGLDVVLQERYLPRTADFTVVLSKAKAAGPDAVLGAGHEADAAPLTRQAREHGFTDGLLGFTAIGSTDDFGLSLGSDAEGVVAFSMWEPQLETAGNRGFVEAYGAKWNRAPNTHAATAYSAAQTLEAAVIKAGSLDRQKIREILSELSVETILPGAFKVDESGMQIGHLPRVIQWQGGKKIVVWPTA